MNLFNYIKNDTHCPICSETLLYCFAEKSREISCNEHDGYTQIKFNLMNSFKMTSLYSYSYNILFDNHHNSFTVEILKQNNILDYVPINVINSLTRKIGRANGYGSNVLKYCPNNCCATSSSKIFLNWKDCSYPDIKVGSFSLDLDQSICNKLDLKFFSVKILSSLEKNQTYISLKSNPNSTSIIEYDYAIQYKDIYKFVKKLPTYLVLS